MWLSPVGTSTYTGGRRQEGGRGQSDESGLVGPGESGQRGGGADIAVLRLPFPGHALDSYLKPLLSAYLTGWAARRGPGFTNLEPGPFPRSLPPNPAGAFQRTGLSSDYAACVTGFAWMTSWQGWQTTRGLAPLPGHEGRPRGLAWSWRAEPGELGDLVDGHRAALPASSHLLVRSRWISSLRVRAPGPGRGQR